MAASVAPPPAAPLTLSLGGHGGGYGSEPGWGVARGWELSAHATPARGISITASPRRPATAAAPAAPPAPAPAPRFNALDPLASFGGAPRAKGGKGAPAQPHFAPQMIAPPASPLGAASRGPAGGAFYSYGGARGAGARGAGRRAAALGAPPPPAHISSTLNLGAMYDDE